MKVLLINPWPAEVFPPPSVGYLQAVLKREGVDVRAVDLDNAFQKDDYDMVAASFHSFSVQHARRIREHYKGWLICGGHHPTALPEQMLSIGYNQVVTGEGESAILSIINGNWESVVKGELSDINSIPFPDYSGLGYEGKWGLPVISSRGCPFDCSFCGSVSFWNRQYRMRTADNVLAELETIINTGAKKWMFEDDNFTAHRKRTLDICKGITEMGKFSWQCNSRAETLDEELCAALKQAGCHTVWLGVESLSQPSLERCRKRTTVEKMIKGINIARKAGLSLRCQFIVGLPGDTLADIEITVKRIKEHKMKVCGANILWTLPNTDAYHRAKKQGFTDDIYLQSGAPFYIGEQSMSTLQKWQRLIRAA